VVNNAKPTVLIGVSGAPGLFTEEIIRAMHSHCSRPIIFPLSNPTSRVEATPKDILHWTSGQALVATGSPFEPVVIDGQTYEIAQCNNSYIFPGIGLGVLATGARRVTDEMLMASSRALAECSPLAINGEGSLLPRLEEIHNVSRHIAFVVGKTAIEQGHALPTTDELLLQAIESNFWYPEYRRYRRTSF
jgi:malate dehydrogenase (oxaloacetate-decarboxylating)